jgi:hypothetical protein
MPAVARLRELTFFLWRREKTKITNELLVFLYKVPNELFGYDCLLLIQIIMNEAEEQERRRKMSCLLYCSKNLYMS